MTSYLLDTNVVSNLSKPRPSPALRSWLSDQLDEQLFIAAISVAEVRRGVLEMPFGRKREVLEDWFSGPSGPKALFGERILPFDEAAAWEWARLMAEGKRTGRPRDALDMIIGSIAICRGFTVVTDNERDFDGIDIINPLRDDDQ